MKKIITLALSLAICLTAFAQTNSQGYLSGNYYKVDSVKFQTIKWDGKQILFISETDTIINDSLATIKFLLNEAYKYKAALEVLKYIPADGSAVLPHNKELFNKAVKRYFILRN